LLAFIISMDDLVITYFIAGVDVTTLPMFIFAMLRRGSNGSSMPIARRCRPIIHSYSCFRKRSKPPIYRRRFPGSERTAISDSRPHLAIRRRSISDRATQLRRINRMSVYRCATSSIAPRRSRLPCTNGVADRTRTLPGNMEADTVGSLFGTACRIKSSDCSGNFKDLGRRSF